MAATHHSRCAPTLVDRPMSGLMEPDPLPFPLGEPPPRLRAQNGVPPDGFEYPGARSTSAGSLYPCPCCCRGWVLLVPSSHDPYGYEIGLSAGCSRGCDPTAIAWWQLLRLGEIPPPEPVEETERSRRCIRGALRHAVRRILEDTDPPARLRREAYALGRLTTGAGVDPGAVAQALAIAAHAVGLPNEAAASPIKKYLLAGMARPRGCPT
jgi:hypothetical protein